MCVGQLPSPNFKPSLNTQILIPHFIYSQASRPRRSCMALNILPNRLSAVFAMWYSAPAKRHPICCPLSHWWPPSTRTSTKAAPICATPRITICALSAPAASTTMRASHATASAPNTRASTVTFIVSMTTTTIMGKYLVSSQRVLMGVGE